MHPCEQVVIDTLGVDVQMQLDDLPRLRSRAHLLLPVRFGCPQEIKKAAGSAARNKGTNASKTLGLPAEPPSSGSQRCRGCRLRTAKKRSGPTRSQFDASSPHRRERFQCDVRNTYGSSPSRQNVPAVRQPRKRSDPTRSSHDAFPSPYGWLS